MVRVQLKSETIQKINDYYHDGLISRDKHSNITTAQTLKQLQKEFLFYKDFDQKTEAKIWMHVINNVWKGVDTDENKRTVFNENEAIFFKNLLKKNGKLTRCYTLSKIFSTCYLNDRTAQRLEEMGIIDIFKLPNYEVLYSMNLHFYQEAVS